MSLDLDRHALSSLSLTIKTVEQISPQNVLVSKQN